MIHSLFLLMIYIFKITDKDADVQKYKIKN